MEQSFAQQLHAQAEQKRGPIKAECWDTPSFKLLEQELAYTASMGKNNMIALSNAWVQDMKSDIASVIAPAVDANKIPANMVMTVKEVLESRGFETAYEQNTGDLIVSFANAKPTE